MACSIINGYPTTASVKVALDLASTAEQSENKGVAGGYAELDESGKVPSAQMPGSVDEVQEYANLAAFPATGAASIIYIAIDTLKTYRWGGTVYGELSASLVLGETSATAYRGDRGKVAYDHSLETGNPHSLTTADLSLENVDNTADADKPISTAAQTALDAKAAGAASSTDHAIARFDGTGGKTLINSGVTIDDLGNITTTGQVVIGANTSQFSNLHPVFSYRWLNNSDLSWKKIADVECSDLSYSCILFRVRLSVFDSNHGASLSRSFVEYYASCRRKSAGFLYDDAIIEGVDSIPLFRIQKLSIGTYELQIRASSYYDAVIVECMEMSGSGATVSYGLAAGSTTGASYNPPTS